MLKIAVTGGIACGKSLVGSFLAEEGFKVCEADDLARELMVPGEDVYKEILDSLGSDFLSSDGSIDRKKLAERIFSDPRELNILNAIVHPVVRHRWLKWLDENRNEHSCAVIVPLLFEAGMNEGWDGIICVSASREKQLERLAQRGLSRNDAEKWIKSQDPVEEKSALSDYVIINNRTIDQLKEETTRTIKHILEKQTCL